MTLQFIHDNRGNTTGVFIPIEDWQTLKGKYTDLQNEEIQNGTELASWQKDILDERLDDYYKNPNDVVDFDTTIANIRKGI
ncbi:addiction module component CHP02574 family protein [Flavobacterium sp. ZT3R18]|uniref:addiction module component CHP02574 family protein n=1 Tax=Flavobacterium sp. ZT3R18 TaxID=2594429 RepID=UPI00163D409B|nr:addiction module component CHP02574 family protein [Flavobacterium sp. ZT3R18]